MTTTRVRCHIAAPREAVYRALLDRDAVARWKVPDDMTCVVHRWEPWEGGELRVSLTYRAPDREGKSSAHTDTYRGRFERLVPNELGVEVDEFESSDVALGGEMRSTIALADAAGGGTELVATHEGVPDAVSAADNELGWRMSLAKLARLVEGRAAE